MTVRDSLPEVLEKLERATPDWRAYPHGVIRSGQFHEYVNGSAQLQNAMFTGEFRDEDRDAAVAAVNWLREHGPGLLRDAGDGWMPIESAPRDGTRVLLCLEGSVIEGWFEPLSPFAEGWQAVHLELHGCGCCSGGGPQPTHWRPLPQSPAMHAPGGAGGGL